MMMIDSFLHRTEKFHVISEFLLHDWQFSLEKKKENVIIGNQVLHYSLVWTYEIIYPFNMLAHIHIDIKGK